MQTTQREWSIRWVLLSMHAALQLRAQRPQPLHFVVSMTGLNKERLDKRPNTVPTGQTVLHHVRPLRHAIIPMTMKAEIDMPNVTALLIHTSIE